jgi:hypothetical protein
MACTVLLLLFANVPGEDYVHQILLIRFWNVLEIFGF